MEIREIRLPDHTKKATFLIGLDGTPTLINKLTDKKQNVFHNLFAKWEGCKIELGQLNSIQLTKNNKFMDMLKDNPLVSIQHKNLSIPQTNEDPIANKSRCNCKRSKCLKLYCECFSRELFCNSDCECNCCANTEVNEKRLRLLRQEMLNKRPAEDRGCRCQKSNCQKKYCDCYNRGLKCGKYCECSNCQNCEEE